MNIDDYQNISEIQFQYLITAPTPTPRPTPKQKPSPNPRLTSRQVSTLKYIEEFETSKMTTNRSSWWFLWLVWAYESA